MKLAQCRSNLNWFTCLAELIPPDKQNRQSYAWRTGCCGTDDLVHVEGRCIQKLWYQLKPSVVLNMSL